MKNLVILIFLLSAFSTALLAQKKSNTTAAAAHTGGLALGLRLGDPAGLTIKKYLPNKRALEFNIGRSSDWGYDSRDAFYDYDEYRDYDYLDYKRGSALGIQARYLFHNNFPDVSNLQWYWGVGAQMRFKTYYYDYRYRQYFGPGSGDYEWVYTKEKVTNVDFGADGIIGLEYRVKNSPFSIFADVNVMLEIYDAPFNFYGQGGIGVRYSLKK